MIILNIQKLEAHAWIAKTEYNEMFGNESKHYLHLETRWETFQLVLNASNIPANLELRKVIQEQDIKGRNLDNTQGINNQLNVSYIVV